jgi:hypothetical protein
MANLFRATFFFEDVQNYGWSETFFSQKATLQDVLVAAQAVVPLRVNMLGGGVSLKYIRVSDDLVKRDSLVKAVSSRDGQNKTIGASSDIANTCILVRLQGSALARRSWYVRGQSDDNVTNSGDYTPTPAFNAALTAMINQLTLDAWCIRTKNPISVPIQVIQVLQNPVNGQITITTTGPHGFLVGSTVTFTGMKGVSFLNGSTTVFFVNSPTSFTINSNQLAGTYLGGGTVVSRLFTLTLITLGFAVRASHRIAGRPFDSHRGRRKGRTRA